MDWAAIREAASIIIMQRPELVRQKRNIDQLLKAEINIKFEEE